jgi:3-phenylpropionate/trans-cinnamate dioxygenase ferredoxin subunit
MKHRLGPLEGFPKGECKILEVGRSSIGVFRLEDDTVYVVKNRCPHQGAPICMGTFGGTLLPSSPDQFEFGLEGRVLHCPWHKWEFDISTGETVLGVDKARLVTYPVTIEDGEVTIEAKAL